MKTLLIALSICAVVVYGLKLSEPVGGYKAVSTTDPEVQEVASFAWQQVSVADARVNLTTASNLIVLTAAKQLVNGLNFKLELTGDFSGTQITVDCVVYKSFAGETTLTSYTVITNALGGYKPVSTSDQDVQTVAMLALGEIASKDSRITLNDVVDLEIISAYQQVVNGKNYKLEIMGEFSGEQTTVDILAYRSLTGEFKLTSYTITTDNSFVVLDAGGYDPVDVNDIVVQYVAMMAVEEIAAQDNRIDFDDVENFTIVSAFKQIVSGTNYKLEMTGAFTGVPLTIDCVVYESLDGNFTLTSFKVTDNSFVTLDVGGYEPVDTSDTNVQTVATFVWGEVSAEDSRIDLNEGTNLVVVSAFEQVVNGKNYKLELTGDFNGIKITIDAVAYQSLAGDLNLTSYTVATESLVGGYDPIGIEDPVVQAAASFAWGEVAAQDSRVDLNEATDLEVVSAFQQIVNGKNLKLEMTGIFNGTQITVDCVVYQSLDGNMSLTDYSVSSDTGMPGGFQPVDPSSADVQDVANWLWKQLAQIAGSGVDLSVGTNLEVEWAEVQVVAGMNYQLRVIGTFGTEDILCDALIYKDLQGNYSLTSYDLHQSNNAVIM